MTFSIDLRAACEKAKGNMEKVVRQTVLLAAQNLILKSPVGNPDLWKVNQNHIAMRDINDRLMYNAFIDEANASLAPGEKKLRKLGKIRLKQGLKEQVHGYVGGRFRGNWVLGVGQVNGVTTEDIDPQGSKTLGAIAAQVQAQAVGQVFYVTNSLPYGRALEYGHSKQAPEGMVRLTMAELPAQIEAIASKVAAAR